MGISFSPSMSRRDFTWADFKVALVGKNGILQCETGISHYDIWFYDGPEINTCLIYITPVPGVVVANGYTQAQNDSDRSDFEANFLPSVNQSIEKRTAGSGVTASASAKGLGGFAPDPKNNPYQPSADEVISLYVDQEGSLVTRGASLTDEGSFRDDFTGSTLEVVLTGTLTFTNGSASVTGTSTLFTSELDRDDYIKIVTDAATCWARVVRAPTDVSLLLDTPYTGTSGTATAHKTRWVQVGIGDTPGTISVGSSKLTMNSGTSSTGGIYMHRDGDYLPMISVWSMSVSQRVTNQTIFFGHRDNPLAPTMYCDVVLDGTDPTVVKFRTAWSSDEQESSVSLPAGLTTAASLRYKLDLGMDYCSLTVNGVLIARHEDHIPDMYASLQMCMGVSNAATVTNTAIVLDTLFWLNTDQVQIASSFQEPISVITKEDQHSIFGKVTSTLTTANQTIISYVVPTGKVFYIIGYRVDMDGTITGLVKIGKNSLTSEPASPGTLDSNLFRAFVLNSGGSSGDIDFGANPRKLGVGGDTILVTVTPTSILSTVWRASIDFVLR